MSLPGKMRFTNDGTFGGEVFSIDGELLKIEGKLSDPKPWVPKQILLTRAHCIVSSRRGNAWVFALVVSGLCAALAYFFLRYIKFEEIGLLMLVMFFAQGLYMGWKSYRPVEAIEVWDDEGNLFCTICNSRSPRSGYWEFVHPLKTPHQGAAKNSPPQP